MLVEDNLINQKVAMGILKQKGVQVTVANNGKEALDTILEASPDTYDLVLMDIDMPVMDGLEAARAILDHPQHQNLPIIALTAHISPKEKDRCFEAGMAQYLTKPVKPQVLYQSIIDNLREP